jgi:hypothetical protein
MSFERKSFHIHRIKPVIFGGDPNDQENVQLVSRMKHAELSTFLNRKIREQTDSNSPRIENRPQNSKLRDIIDGYVSIHSAELKLNIKFPDDFSNVSGIFKRLGGGN